MVGELVYFLLISEARIKFATGNIISMEGVISLGMIRVVPELRQHTQRVVSIVQVQSEGNANCTEEKPKETPIMVSGDMLNNFCRQWQHWLLAQHLRLWSVILQPDREILVHISAAMSTVASATSISDYQDANFDC